MRAEQGMVKMGQPSASTLPRTLPTLTLISVLKKGRAPMGRGLSQVPASEEPPPPPSPPPAGGGGIVGGDGDGKGEGGGEGDGEGVGPGIVTKHCWYC